MFPCWYVNVYGKSLEEVCLLRVWRKILLSVNKGGKGRREGWLVLFGVMIGIVYNPAYREDAKQVEYEARH